MAYWVAASSGRKRMYDVQAATGQAGSLSKQVTSVTHDIVVSEDDCGTDDTGVPFKAADPQNIGRVLLRPFHNHPAGEVVTADMVAEADDDEEMLLRTPATCK
jgi:DNA-directed RNA polymerase subunit beta'